PYACSFNWVTCPDKILGYTLNFLLIIANAGSFEAPPTNESLTVFPSGWSDCTNDGANFSSNKLLTNFFVVGCSGSVKTSKTEPDSTTLPSSMTATLSQIFWMTSISCVMSKMVTPNSSLIFTSKSKIASVVSGSSALVASSLNNTSGS